MSAADLPTIPRWALPSAVRLAPKIVLKEFPCVRGRNCFAVRRRSLQHGGNINFRCHPEEVCPHVFMRALRAKVMGIRSFRASTMTRDLLLLFLLAVPQPRGRRIYCRRT